MIIELVLLRPSECSKEYSFSSGSKRIGIFGSSALALREPQEHGLLVTEKLFGLRIGATWPGQGRGSRKPGSAAACVTQLVICLVDLVAFADVKVARVLALAGAGRDRPQRGAAEEGHLDVVREDVERQEPTLALDAIERRVPLHG